MNGTMVVTALALHPNPQSNGRFGSLGSGYTNFPESRIHVCFDKVTGFVEMVH